MKDEKTLAIEAQTLLIKNQFDKINQDYEKERRKIDFFYKLGIFFIALTFLVIAVNQIIFLGACN